MENIVTYTLSVVILEHVTILVLILAPMYVCVPVPMRVSPNASYTVASSSDFMMVKKFSSLTEIYCWANYLQCVYSLDYC